MTAGAMLTNEDQSVLDAVVTEDAQAFRALRNGGWSPEAIEKKARDLGVTDRLIKACRLSGSHPTMRDCIRCDVRFLSEGAHNRLCRRCVPR